MGLRTFCDAPSGLSERLSPRISCPHLPTSDNLNGMQQPPFQFRLRTIFEATTVAAALLAIGVAAPEAAALLAGLAASFLPFVLCGFLFNKLALWLMESVPHKSSDAEAFR